MKILRNIKVPTGNILVVQGDCGKLEMLSIGDYGQQVNVKADFLGLSNPPEKMVHQKLLPLEEKWVVTISTQTGCRINCACCDVPKVDSNPKNATCRDLVNQVITAVYNLHLGVNSSKRLNIHFARMGEPTYNPAVLESIPVLYNLLNSRYNIHPVVSTMMPNNNEWLGVFLKEWMSLKNNLMGGNAGLQLSINSTDEKERNEIFNYQCLSLSEIFNIMSTVMLPLGRKIALNFAVADYTIDPAVLLKYFDPSYYMIKLTPMHKTTACKENGIKTDGDYTTYHPYESYEKALTAAGYDVLVFLATEEEDLSTITCGNAILGGSEILTEFVDLPIIDNHSIQDFGFNNDSNNIRKSTLYASN
jgi:23S rRNA (adenine2503-C2)-methyltransferase